MNVSFGAKEQFWANGIRLRKIAPLIDIYMKEKIFQNLMLIGTFIFFMFILLLTKNRPF